METTTTTTTTTDLAYCGITAPGQIWADLEFTVHHWVGGTQTVETNSQSPTQVDLEAAKIQVGDSGVRALAWLSMETQRRNEERTRSTAAARQAEAMDKLAAAIHALDLATIERGGNALAKAVRDLGDTLRSVRR